MTVIFSLNCFIRCQKVIHLLDSRDLFKISNFVSGGKEIVTSLYSSLVGQREKTSMTRAEVYTN